MKLLANGNARQQSTDPEVHLGVEQRCRGVALLHLPQEAAGLRLRQRFGRHFGRSIGKRA